jgi:hypothetical protein
MNAFRPTFRPTIAAVLLLLAGASALAADKPTRAEKSEARLAELLKGRTAGTPVTCIPSFQADELEVLDGVAMVYGKGETLYVARPKDPKSLRWDDVIVINRVGGQLCNTDIVRTVDRMSGFTTGVVFLDKFVPYKKQN